MSLSGFGRNKSRAAACQAAAAREGTRGRHSRKTVSRAANRRAGIVPARASQVLVATDIEARGIDVAGISHVVNYDVPTEAEA